MTFLSQLLAAQLVLLQDLYSGAAELIFSSDSASFFDPASYFGTVSGIDSVSYVHRNRENSWVFWLSSPSSTEWHMVGFSFSRFLEEVF